MRSSLLVLALLPCLPSLAEAQLDPAPAPSRVGVTVYTGARVPYNTGFVTVSDAGGEPLYSVTERRGGGPLLGVDAEVLLRGRFSALLGGIYSPAGISGYFVDRESGFRDAADFRVRSSGETLFARAGVSMRVQAPPRVGETRARPATDLFAAAGMVRQFESIHPAANFGFKGAFPLRGSGLEIAVGVEDFLVFWDEAALTPHLANELRPDESPVGLTFLYGTSNVVLLRAGLSVRF